MYSKPLTREELWARQQISSTDVDYPLWHKKREAIQQISVISQSCLFTVDVFKGRYDFASESFADLFGYSLLGLREIQKQGDLLEERFHPDDRAQIIDMQIQHGQFIYSLPPENRNDYSQTFQFRILNRKRQYINIISRQQVLQKDHNGKAWIILGIMDISPDQTPTEKVKHSILNLRTGEIVSPFPRALSEAPLTQREKEILHLICQGLLSKEIAHLLKISIFTVNNHRKNILAKLQADNTIEAINRAKNSGILD